MKRTRSDPIQFRLMLEDWDVLAHLAAQAGSSPKDYVVDLVLAHLAAHRDAAST
jgi:uncharacterized protein (DUF1778 family)